MGRYEAGQVVGRLVLEAWEGEHSKEDCTGEGYPGVFRVTFILSCHTTEFMYSGRLVDAG